MMSGGAFAKTRNETVNRLAKRHVQGTHVNRMLLFTCFNKYIKSTFFLNKRYTAALSSEYVNNFFVYLSQKY